MKQPAIFVIEQQDEETWWVLTSVDGNKRPPEWMRKFEAGFQDAMTAFLFAPLTKVHSPLPADETLLAFAEQNDKVLKNGPINLKAGEMYSNPEYLPGYVKPDALKPDTLKSDALKPEGPELDIEASKKKVKLA